MDTVVSLVWSWWGQLWPNIISAPIVAFFAWATHYAITRRHLLSLHSKVDELHRKIDAGGGNNGTSCEDPD